MELGLDGKTALVFGAGGGLGSAIAISLAREGANVAAADINVDAAEKVTAEIRRSGGKANAIQWDLADLESIPGRVAQVREMVGEVDVLVNNTGGPPPTPAAGQSLDLWSKHFQSMILSVIAITDQVLPGMCTRGWGRIITSASSGVVAPIPNLGVSNALRSTLVGWSKTLAREVGQHGVTANVVVPGRIATARITSLDQQRAKREDRTVESVQQESTGSIPLKRYGTPQEYGDVVAFLASRQASYVTGSIIRIDGGLIPSV